MSSIDNRVVKMQFDNASFKREALATKSSLDQVDAAVAKAGKGTGLLSLSKGMETVRVKASAMQVAAVTALANITNKAVDAGLRMAKSFSIDPIKQGFDEYELKMKSIQTILANTDGENLKTVTSALDELNKYSDKTIYNFANMTENIGKLTTAGIELDDATGVVKGFHNMVALAGGDATAAAGAMEQFGQGLQAGTIKAMDWMSISNRGLGSQNLQKAFFETARAFGPLKDVPLTTTFDEWTKANGGFKASLEQGWLTTEVATGALKTMTGDVKNVQELVKQGFSPEVAKDMLEIADNAVESATKVRTFTAFMDTTKESLASGWAKVIETVLGDFNESTKLFTSLSNIVGGAIGKTFGYINNLVEGWDKMGGRAALLTTIQHILAPIGAILGLIATGWKAAFGGTKTGKGLADMTKGLEMVTRPLEIFAKVITGAEAPLSAFFRLLNIGKNVLVGVAKQAWDFVSGFMGMVNIDVGSGGGIIDFVKEVAKQIGDAIKKVDNLIQKGVSLKDALGKVDISLPSMPDIPGLPSMPKMAAGGDSWLSSNKLDGMITSMKDLNLETGKLAATDMDARRMVIMGEAPTLAAARLKVMGGALGGITEEGEKAATVGDKVAPAVKSAWDTLKKFFEGFNIEDLMAAFNLAILSTFMISMSRFMNTMSEGFKGFVGTGEALTGMFGGVTDALGSMQTTARSKMIMAIAVAIGVLAVSLWLLSKIPAKQLASGLAGLAGIMLILKVGVDSITKAADAMSAKGSVFKLGSLALVLVALGFAILLLAGAFLILDRVSWSGMLKGLGTIIIVMKLIESMGKVGEHGAKNLLASAVALTALSFSLVILAGALMLFELVKWENMAKGGLVLGALVGSMALLAKLPAASLAKVGGAMLGASFGFLMLAGAFLIFQMVKWESIGKGAVALGLLTGSLAILQVVGNPVAIAGLIGLGLGMMGLAAAMLIMNNVEWSSIGKAGVVLLGLIAAFGLFMAIVYFAAPVLPLLTGLALSLALLAGALALLTLSVAIILPLMALGVGAFAAFATGAAVAIAVFLTTLALQAPIMKKSILTLLQVLIDGIVEAVPMIIDGFKRLFKAIKDQFAGGGEGGGKMQASMGKSGESWITKLTEGIKKKIPMIVEKAVELGKKFIDGVIKYAPVIAAKGAELVIALINGLSSKIGGIVDSATNLIIKFAEGIGNNLNRIIDAGVKLIADFLHKLASTIRSGSAAIGSGIRDVVDAMRDVGVDIVKGIISGIDDMFDDAMNAIGNLASGMVNKAKGILDIFSPSKVFKKIGNFLVDGLTIGIQERAATAIVATASMVSGSIAVASAYVSQFVQELDQQAIVAAGKADGLRRAAEKASKAAQKTEKNKKDDRAANKLGNRADRADKAASKAEAQASKAADAQERAAIFAKSDTFDKAKMRSEDAQSALDGAKLSERRAIASLAEAAALEKQAKADGVTKKQRKEMLAQAAQLRKEAKQQAASADSQLSEAQVAAGDALALQTQAGNEAAASFQTQFDNEAAEDAASAAFDLLTPAQKAAQRREQAAALQAEANRDLADAKVLAYTDLDAANELAAEAMEQAEQARNYLAEALQLDAEVIAAADAAANGTGASGAATASRVVNLDPTEAAAIAFNKYNDSYLDASASAAGGQTVEFNMYNTSPEALNPSEIYRQSNNLLSFAAGKLQPAA